MLLDAKDWKNGWPTIDGNGNLPPTDPDRLLPFARDSVLKDARGAIDNAGDHAVEWVMSDKTTADLVRNLFEQEGIPIAIVDFPG